MSEPNDISMAEYQALRDEIARHEEQVFSAFTFSLAGAAAILAWGFERQSWLVLAVAPLILLPTGLLILARVKAELRIAAYLRVFFEDPGPSLNWETVLLKLARRDRSPDALFAVALFLPIVLVGGASLVAAWMLGWGDTSAMWFLGVESGLVAVLVGYVIYLMFTLDRGKIVDDFLGEIHTSLKLQKPEPAED